jgi:hypothetical protein
MSTSGQEMTPLLERLRRQIAAERGYSCFQERVSVEEVVKAYACAAGLDACDLLRSWAGMEPRPKPARKRTPPPRLVDDDDQPVLPDNDDDSPPTEEERTKVCSNCRGTGRARSGARCRECNGTGRIPSVIDDENEDDDKESLTYEIEFDED